ncbi:MAG: helix-turn-helix domain-containing protein [Candidatus Nitrosocosmicus sp.]
MKLSKSQETKSLVVQKYLEGKSMDKIVDEINISKGSVYSIIRDWKNNIERYNITEIRNFISSCTKSKITIEQCIQGFRMVNILKDFGIDKDSHDNIDEMMIWILI